MDTDNLDDLTAIMEKHCGPACSEREKSSRFFVKKFIHCKLLNPIGIMLDKEKNKALALITIDGVPRVIDSLKELEEILAKVGSMGAESVKTARIKNG